MEKIKIRINDQEWSLNDPQISGLGTNMVGIELGGGVLPELVPTLTSEESTITIRMNALGNGGILQSFFEWYEQVLVAAESTVCDVHRGKMEVEVSGQSFVLHGVLPKSWFIKNLNPMDPVYVHMEISYDRLEVV